MKRRAFLGFLGGAAAAGPKMAASLVDSAAQPPMPGYYGGIVSGISPASNDPWRLERIAKLKSILSGEDPQEKRNRAMNALYQLETLERHRLDGLRSVAGQYKARMLVSGGIGRQERIRRTEAEFELSDLLELKLPF